MGHKLHSLSNINEIEIPQKKKGGEHGIEL